MFKSKKTNAYQEYQNKKSPRKNAGFYIALAICAVTVGAAAWTTYGSVMDYNEISEESTEQSEGVTAGKDVSNEKYQNTAEQSRTTSKAESQPDVSENEEDMTWEEEVSQESEPDAAVETAVETSSAEPVENGKIIKIFSPDNPIQSKTMSDWRTHSGIDLSAPEGTAVRAISEGTVQSVEQDPLLGNVIVIEHSDGYTSYYCGLTETTVAQTGDTVASGDTIGYIGTVPGEILDESHLHLEVRKGDELVDPASLF